MCAIEGPWSVSPRTVATGIRLGSRVRRAQANEIALFKIRRQWRIRWAELDERIEMQPHRDGVQRDGD